MDKQFYMTTLNLTIWSDRPLQQVSVDELGKEIAAPNTVSVMTGGCCSPISPDDAVGMFRVEGLEDERAQLFGEDYAPNLPHIKVLFSLSSCNERVFAYIPVRLITECFNGDTESAFEAWTNFGRDRIVSYSEDCCDGDGKPFHES